MKQNRSISNEGQSVRRAEQIADSSLQRFESAMDHLAGRIDNTTARVKRYKGYLDKPRQWTQQSIEFATPYYNRSRRVAEDYVNEVRANPRPFVWTAVGVATVMLLLRRRGRRG